MKFTGGTFLLLASIACSTGCTALRPATAPMATIERRVGADGGKPILLVLLHGRGDQARKFFDEGFDRIADASGRRFDLVSVEAHQGYYVKGQLEIRIEADILAPARARDYESIWLVGTSMGGLGALISAQRHSDAVDGIILLAPYLGSERVIASVEQGIPLAGDLGSEDRRTKDLWEWVVRTPASERPTVLVGVGDRDSFLRANRLLGRFQPASHFEAIPGGHDWDTWVTLFRWALFHPEGPIRK